MAFDLQTFRAQVDSLISADDKELSRYRRELQIKAAVEQYSIDRPHEVTEDVTGDGGRYYPLTGGSAVLAKFVDGFSRVLSIEYPAKAVSTDHEPQMLDPSAWDDDYWDATLRYLSFRTVIPVSGDLARVRHTAPFLWTVATATTSVLQNAHGFSANDWIYFDTDDGRWRAAKAEEVAIAQVTAAADANNFTYKSIQCDVPAEHFHAVCHLAASLICMALASKYSRTTDSTINADSVDHPSRGSGYASRAREHRTQYEKHIQRGEAHETEGDGYSQFVDVSTSPEWPRSRGYLFHRR